MDSDDIMTPTKLADLKSALAEVGEGYLSVGLVDYFSAATLGNGYLRYQDWLNQLTASSTNFQEIYKECVIPSPCWMIHRKDLDKCGAFVPDVYPEDYDLCFRFYKAGLKIVGVNKVLHQWRDYPTRTSRTDEHYADNSFLALKVHYFVELEYDKTKELCVWGAGKKGKSIVQKLIKQNIPFHWVCNNENKIGKDIYGVIMEGEEVLSNLQNTQIIIAVAADGAQEGMNTVLQEKECYYFC